MSKLFKLIFLALLSAFIVGCGHHSGGSSSKSDNTTLGDDNTSTIDDNNTKDDNGTTDDNNTTEDNTTAIEAFMSDFPVFDAGGKAISNSFIGAAYSPLSIAEAEAVNTTLTGLKGFFVDSVSEYMGATYIDYTPSYDITAQNLTHVYASAYINNDDDSGFAFGLETTYNRTIAYSEFDDIFGTVNSTIGYVDFTIHYDVDMSAEFDVYYHQLLDSGVFEEAECSFYEEYVSWICYKFDGTFYYQWYASGQYTDWYKGTTEP